jgi:hypothetical protein
MGYFTWTDARRQSKKNKNEDYPSKDKIPYGDFAKVVCPDNSEIKESHYEGYGMFNGQDIYDLVVDWNKAHLIEIFERLKQKNSNHWGNYLNTLAMLYQTEGENSENFIAEKQRLAKEESPLLLEEWKRTIGITIACDEEDNKNLPYPIKITTTKWHRQYDELYPSNPCQ